ncbi:hypothetical protein BS47DRAFT_1383585 [Hydnum rufescens UP504]|uniref:Ribosomal protein L9 domain-containing protein n=1 Tax=Hydnum rufescens UP504 TaxID=1448309 RepID=A0A9P6ASI0_9AGAM|nr:hypothetical protein BS47DRAFT_1383585 [Hydnum rufescens UP504]
MSLVWGSLVGSLQEVRPGYMRNYLKPRDLANYVLRDVGPALMSRPEAEPDVSPQVEEFPSFFSQITPSAPTPVLDIGKLRERLATLPPLIFSRRVREDALAGGMQPIYGSGHITKLRSIGQWTAEVRLKNGDVVPLIVQVAKQEQQQ